MVSEVTTIAPGPLVLQSSGILRRYRYWYLPVSLVGFSSYLVPVDVLSRCLRVFGKWSSTLASSSICFTCWHRYSTSVTSSRIGNRISACFFPFFFQWFHSSGTMGETGLKVRAFYKAPSPRFALTHSFRSLLLLLETFVTTLVFILCGNKHSITSRFDAPKFYSLGFEFLHSLQFNGNMKHWFIVAKIQGCDH